MIKEKLEAIDKKTRDAPLIASIRARMKDIETQTTKLQSTLHDSSTFAMKMDSFEEELRQIQSSLESYMDETSSLIGTKDSSSIPAELQRLSTNVTSVENKLMKVNKTLKEVPAIQRNVTRLQDENHKISLEVQEMNQMAKRIQSLETALTQVQNEASALRALVATLTQKLPMKVEKTEVQQLVQEAVGTTRDMIKGDLNQLGKEISAVDGKVAEVDSKVGGVGNTIEAFRSQLDLQLEDVVSTQSNLRDHMEGIATRVSSLDQEELKPLRTRVDNVQKVADNANVRGERLEMQLSKVKGDIAIAREDTREVENDLSSLRAEVSDNGKQIARLDRTVMELARNIKPGLFARFWG
ncbi:hypothetical protein K474DRAFT_1663676 [Panus rudis PR-1116 ss-1]|nr:hypothetical protein K474DRAFT_1663676 [Panus rudis PR-1116 ss-1]